MGLAKASLEANVRFLAADLGPQGIRVNAISAGPIKTLAAAGVSGFRKMLTHVASHTPLRRNVTTDEVGNAAAFLCSDLASGITGEVLYVDAGYSHVGMASRKKRTVGMRQHRRRPACWPFCTAPRSLSASREHLLVPLDLRGALQLRHVGRELGDRALWPATRCALLRDHARAASGVAGSVPLLHVASRRTARRRRSRSTAVPLVTLPGAGRGTAKTALSSRRRHRRRSSASASAAPAGCRPRRLRDVGERRAAIASLRRVGTGRGRGRLARRLRHAGVASISAPHLVERALLRTACGP